MPLRVITAFPIALIVYLITEFHTIWVWMGLYLVAQLLEVWILRPSSATWRKPSLGRMIFVITLFVFPAVVLSGICGALWLLGGSYGPALAVFLISGSVINLIVISAQSRIAFLTSSAPYLLTAALVVIFDPDVTPFYRPVMILACLLMLSSSMVTWRLFERAISAQKDALREAETRRQEAEAALRAKGGYIATVSQELKSPINAILSAAAQLQGPTPPGDVRGHAQRIARSGSTMRGLLNDLADFAKLESGGMLVEHIPFDLRRKGHDVLRAWRPAARRKGLRLKLEGGASLPRWVNGDPMRISQALNALFATAIRDTETGMVTIRLSAGTGDDGRIGVKVVLIDNGPGYSTSELEDLFSPFERTGAHFGGASGLGLAISRELARLMGGDLTVESRPGEGSTLTLNFRVYPIDAPEPQDILSAVMGTRVLLVAPSPVHRRAMELLLPLGLQPAVAETGETALAMLDRQAFDIVLMGVSLPGMNGFEVTRRLRTSPNGNRTIPVVGLVPSAAPRDWDGCRRAGMNSWVAAPIDGPELYAAMAEALVARRRSRETAPA